MCVSICNSAVRSCVSAGGGEDATVGIDTVANEHLIQ